MKPTQQKSWKLIVQLENNLPEKNSAEGRNRTQRVWVRVPCPNIYSTEVVRTYPSRTYRSFKFSQVRQPNGKILHQTKKLNSFSLVSVALSKRLFQWNFTWRHFPNVHFSQTRICGRKCSCNFSKYLSRNLVKKLGYTVIAFTFSDQVMNRTEKRRTTEKQSEREREDLHQPAVYRNSFTTPTNPYLFIVDQISEKRYVSFILV